MTSAAAVHRLDRANAVAWAGLAAIAAYFGVLTHGVAAWPYDEWMVLILAPALLAIGTVVIVAVTRDDEERLTTLIVVALVKSSTRPARAAATNPEPSGSCTRAPSSTTANTAHTGR